jgi:HEAT repeat protein
MNYGKDWGKLRVKIPVRLFDRDSIRCCIALNYDSNVDVRLAAIDALSRFAADPDVRSGLVKSLPIQKSPLVQISLIDLLVQLQERQSIEVLKRIADDAGQNQQVCQRAERGVQKLI